jgi:hypothetical protein
MIRRRQTIKRVHGDEPRRPGRAPYAVISKLVPMPAATLAGELAF